MGASTSSHPANGSSAYSVSTTVQVNVVVPGRVYSLYLPDAWSSSDVWSELEGTAFNRDTYEMCTLGGSRRYFRRDDVFPRPRTIALRLIQDKETVPVRLQGKKGETALTLELAEVLRKELHVDPGDYFYRDEAGVCLPRSGAMLTELKERQCEWLVLKPRRRNFKS